ALDTIRTACAITIAGALGQIKCASVSSNQMGAFFTLSLNAVGIAKASGLHLLDGGINGRCGGAAKFPSVHNQRRTSSGNLLQNRRSKIVHRNLRRCHVGLLWTPSSNLAWHSQLRLCKNRCSRQ